MQKLMLRHSQLDAKKNDRISQFFTKKGQMREENLQFYLTNSLIYGILYIAKIEGRCSAPRHQNPRINFGLAILI